MKMNSIPVEENWQKFTGVKENNITKEQFL